MEITLTPEIEGALVEQADQRGTTPEHLALETLRERFVKPVEQELPGGAETLADLLNGYIGVLHSAERVPGGARMSEDTGHKFAKGMIKKREQGE